MRQKFIHRSPLRTAFLKSIPASGIQPHGIWCSPDNTRIYAVNEHSDTVDVIDTSSLSVVDTLKVGQEGQALIYVAGAVTSGDGKQILVLKAWATKWPTDWSISQTPTRLH